MPSFAGNDRPPVHDVLLDNNDTDETRLLQLGTELWSRSGRRWVVQAFHPDHRVELVADAPTGTIGMIIDAVAAARMIPTDALSRVGHEAEDTAGPTDSRNSALVHRGVKIEADLSG